MQTFKLSEERQLADYLSQVLGHQVLVAVCDKPLETSRLSAAGQQRLLGLNSESRRQEWLSGRCALQTVMLELGDYDDMALLDFPHPRYSLTHSHGTAVAIAAVDDGIAGIGIDYEQCRPVKHGIERFFLSAQESELLSRATDKVSLLRLWTAKEAMFKSDPDNAGRLLKDYPLAAELALQGDVELADLRIRYIGLTLGDGPFAAAISERATSPR